MSHDPVQPGKGLVLGLRPVRRSGAEESGEEQSGVVGEGWGRSAVWRAGAWGRRTAEGTQGERPEGARSLEV